MQEMMPKENILAKPTAEDLKNAEIEYLEAANSLNAFDLSDENLTDEELAKRGDRYKKASKKYSEIHKFLHPEMYEGENKDVTILPTVEMNEDLKDMISFSG